MSCSPSARQGPAAWDSARCRPAGTGTGADWAGPCSSPRSRGAPAPAPLGCMRRQGGWRWWTQPAPFKWGPGPPRVLRAEGTRVKGLVVVRPGSPGPSPSASRACSTGCKPPPGPHVPVPCPSPALTGTQSAQGSRQARGRSQQQAQSREHSAAVSPPLGPTRKFRGSAASAELRAGAFIMPRTRRSQE